MTIIRMTIGLLLASSAAVAQNEALDASAVRECLRKGVEALGKLQYNGGWCCKYAENGAVVWGEYRPLPKGWITVQPPATPVIAEAVLNAAAVLDDSPASAMAGEARAALLAIQTAEGGFPHEADPTGKRPAIATLDDDTTTAAIRFLLAWWKHTGKTSDFAEVLKAGDFLIASQFPEIGAWPQAYPLRANGYSHHITFNDNVFFNAVMTLLLLHRETGEIRYLEAVRRAGEAAIRIQGGDGEAIWPQQCDAETLMPVWARKFEPPGYAAAESVGVYNALIEISLALKDRRYLDPLPKAFHWYDTHKLENGKWARLYEPGTHRPVYGRRDKAEKVYALSEAASGYSWQGDWYPSKAKGLYTRIQQGEEGAILAERAAEQAPVRSQLAGAVRDVIRAQGSDGRWMRPPTPGEAEVLVSHGEAADLKIADMRDASRNIRLLSQWLGAEER